MKTILLCVIVLFCGSLSAQSVDRCMTVQAIEYQESITPGYKAQLEKNFQLAKKRGGLLKADPIYTIPVVVHVVYNTPEQNLPDSVIIDQIEVLTNDYNRWNADTVNMRPDFDPVKGNPGIRFKLAQIDPQGSATTGITRTQTATESFGSFAIFTGSFADLENVKSTANGGHDPWDQGRYLNIWVCNMSLPLLGPALLGYATPPSGLPNWPTGQTTTGLSDGVVIQYQAFGSNNPVPIQFGQTAYEVAGRTCVHEVGHYLGLRHIWGDGDCAQEDGIDDTPNADSQSNQDCDFTRNTCTDNIVGTDLPDMVENYMDYSAETCQNSFTEGQVQLMHGVLEDQRYDLVHNNPAAVPSIAVLELEVFPNPVSTVLTIRSSNTEELDLTLSDVNGRSVQTSRMINGTHTLSLQDLEKGIYQLRIGNSRSFAIKQIVKN
jgi:hypothetical protein